MKRDNTRDIQQVSKIICLTTNHSKHTGGIIAYHFLGQKFLMNCSQHSTTRKISTRVK